MKYIEFKKFTDENGARPIYLFEGEEVYFREKGEELIKARFVQDTTLDFIAFDGNTLKGDKLKAIGDALNSFPFLSEKRLVKITEFYPTEKDYESYLKPVFENPPSSGILLILNGSKPKAGCVTLSKQNNVTHVDCGRSDEETIKKWIYITCKREGVYVDGITSGKIASYCLLDMSRIAKETEKLLLYAQAQQLERITDEIVDMLIYPDAEYKIYELANALARKNYSAFMKIVADLTARGFNETALLSSLASYFKGLYEVSLSKGSDAEIAVALGMKEYGVKKNREQASKFKDRELIEFYDAIYTVISGIKCGEIVPDSAFKAITAKLFFGKS